MSNLLLITDVARLRKVFGRLTEDKNIRLRVVNNLEKGGEELTVEKPDVVFVQTHLSGLSADILLMHLKKQLGRKRSRFVLLASPGQINDAILKPYQAWLDTSAEDGQLLSQLQHLLVTLLSKPKKSEESAAPEPVAVTDFTPQLAEAAQSSFPDVSPLSDEVPAQQAYTALQFPVATPASPEPSLEEQGITYAPRQRLSVYSEFNSSFDNAVSSTAEPETLEQATPPTLAQDWNAEDIDTVDTKPTRSKRGTFLLWLAPVVIAVVFITYLQQRPAPKPDPATKKPAPAAMVKLAAQAPSPNASLPNPAKTAAVAPPAAPKDQDRMSDKAVLSAITENRDSKNPVPVAASGMRLKTLPDFIPRNGFDKQYGTVNPGWERYKGEVTEFKVLRQDQTIKAIQVIDRGGQGVPESFMKAVLRQVTKKPLLNIESSEKKEGYEIQRGRIAENIKVVYYRDDNGGKLRALVLTWEK